MVHFRRQDAGQTQAGSGCQVTIPAAARVAVSCDHAAIGLFMSVIMLIITSIGNFTTPDGRARRAFDAGNNAFHTFSYSQAIAEYDQAIRLKPDFGEASYQSRSRLSGQGRRRAGSGRLRPGRQVHALVIRCLRQPGTRLSRHRRVRQGDRRLGQALEHEYIADERAAAYDNRGIAYCYKEDYAQAIADFDAAIRATVKIISTCRPTRSRMKLTRWINVSTSASR